MIGSENMSLIYQRHEPASVKNELFNWIKLDSSDLDGFYFLEKAPKQIELLNRYLIENSKATAFINFLAESYNVSSCIKLAYKSLHLTQIQRLFKQKCLKKEGWNELAIKKGVFLKECTYIDSNQLELCMDYYFDSIYVINKDKNSSEELIQILDSIDFFKQPKKLGTFCPTEKFITGLINYKVAVIFHKRDFCDIDCAKERPIFICYSPWKL
jgi:hypothetical protein